MSCSSKSNNTYIIMNKLTDTALAFIKGLEHTNAKEITDLFVENGEIYLPYSNGLFVDALVGKKAIEEFYVGVFANFTQMSFDIIEIEANPETGFVFMNFTGKILIGEGKYYGNNYYSTFRIQPDGLIEKYVEVFDPVLAARELNLMDKIK